jgi:general secretion pathway protein A
MYEHFYGLKEKPFKLLPDPEFFFMSRDHDNAYVHLKYAIIENKGFVVLTGEIGSGKTTLINYFLSHLKANINVGLIYNTQVTPPQFIKAMCREFQLDVECLNKAECLLLFSEFLLAQFADKKRVVLIIDEAQNLPVRTLEEIRMLSNLEAEKNHLIQIILVGQPQLNSKLRQPDLEQFAQRVLVNYHLYGLQKSEVEPYIRYRLAAGGSRNSNIFTAEAIDAISEYSRCNPRIVNVICDNALVYGFTDSTQIIDKAIIDNVIKAREETELFSYDEPAENWTAGRSPSDITISQSLDKRLQSIETRLQSIEGLIENLKNHLDFLLINKEVL